MLTLLVACSLALCVTAFWLLLYAYEHQRFHRSRLRKSIDVSWAPRVTLFVPCKGLETQLTEHLQALFDQRYPHFELCFIVESEVDPVLPVIDTLRLRNSGAASRVVIAGIGKECGQKVHNLIQATRTVSPETEVLAFADSDAHPHVDWLWRLVGRLGSGRNGVATGYRWYEPTTMTLPNLLLSCINGQVLALIGSTSHNLAWGGAWAIRKETFTQLGFPSAWEGTLSDDLTLSRLVHNAKLGVVYEPHCLTTSHAETQWSGLIEFVRRQYLIVRIYAPRWYWGAFLGGAVMYGSLWSLVLSTVSRLMQGNPWLWPATVSATFYGVLMLRCWAYTSAIRPFLQVDSEKFRRVQLLAIALAPVIATINWVLQCSSVVGRTIVWRGSGYRLDSATHTTVLFRPEERLRSVSSPPVIRAA